MNSDFFFWSIVAIIAVAVVAISARLIFRITLFIFSLFALWYLAYLLGISSSPIGYFQKEDKAKTERPCSFERLKINGSASSKKGMQGKNLELHLNKRQ